MMETLDCFTQSFIEYNGQPHVYLLIVYHLDDPGYQAITSIALNEYEAEEWKVEPAGTGLGKKFERILIHKPGGIMHIGMLYE